MCGIFPLDWSVIKIDLAAAWDWLRIFWGTQPSWIPKIDAAANHFSKFKVTTIYFEAPVELRYFSDPAHPGKSWKAAAGFKLGTLLRSYSKGKNMVSSAGTSINGKTYIQKEQNKRFFNSTSIALTARGGYGIFSVDVG